MSHYPIPSTQAQESIADLSVEEMRQRLEDAGLETRKAKASAASANLQYNLLCLEHSEALKRKDVELDMLRKDVEVLRSRMPHHDGSLVTPMSPTAQPVALSPNDQQFIIWKNRCTALEIENENLRAKLDDLMNHWTEERRDLVEENRRLRDRIRDNRRHINQIRAANGLPEGTPASAFMTPRTNDRFTQPPSSGQMYSSSKRPGDGAFDVLLAAGQALSQEANTTPSTPTPHQNRRSQHGHHRATHSLSSLPSTPIQARSVPHSARTADFYHTPAVARMSQVPATAPVQRQRRRESRDSTISATDLDEQAQEASISSPELDSTVTESRASQEAANLLRKSGSFPNSFDDQSRSSRSDLGKSHGLLQQKLYGQVTKPGLTKRKPSGNPSGMSPTKKGRGEPVGLGIGGWSDVKRS